MAQLYPGQGPPSSALAVGWYHLGAFKIPKLGHIPDQFHKNPWGGTSASEFVKGSQAVPAGSLGWELACPSHQAGVCSLGKAILRVPQCVRYFGSLHFPLVLPVTSCPAQSSLPNMAWGEGGVTGCTGGARNLVCRLLCPSFLACCAALPLHKCCLFLFFFFKQKTTHGFTFIAQDLSCFKDTS